MSETLSVEGGSWESPSFLCFSWPIESKQSMFWGCLPYLPANLHMLVPAEVVLPFCVCLEWQRIRTVNSLRLEVHPSVLSSGTAHLFSWFSFIPWLFYPSDFYLCLSAAVNVIFVLFYIFSASCHPCCCNKFFFTHMLTTLGEICLLSSASVHSWKPAVSWYKFTVQIGQFHKALRVYAGLLATMVN